jgi:hypothetical protein
LGALAEKADWKWAHLLGRSHGETVRMCRPRGVSMWIHVIKTAQIERPAGKKRRRICVLLC